MQIAPEVTYRNVPKTDAVESLVQEKIGKLEQFCNYMNSCRVAVEKAHEHPNSGSPYRVRIDITVPPSHELVVSRNPGEGNQYDPLETVIRDAFEAARRQLVELVERQRDEIKEHPQQEMQAVVTKLFEKDGYGFLKEIETGREIYFHKNSVSHDDFDRLEVGTGVHFAEEDGQMGPQATTVQIVNKPGVQLPKSDAEAEAPMGWQ